MVIINFGVKTIITSQKMCKDEKYVGFAGSNLYKQSNKVYVVMKKFL